MSLFANISNPSNSSPNKFRFVSIGECMVEMAPADKPGQFQMGFAGDTFNTAWYVKTLAPEWATRYVSRVGMDDVSDQLVHMMDDAGIDTAHMQRSKTRGAGLYLISVQDGERSFSYWRDHSAARQLADDETALIAATEDADIIYFSGITMAILDAAGRAKLLGVIKGAREAGKTIVFDSNLRPRLWANAEEMTQTVMQAAAASDIVLPSYDDEAAHFGDADIFATRDRYLDTGASVVVVKDGAGEVHYSKDGQTGFVKPPVAERIVDTTSAGDSFNAGFLVGLAQTGSMQDAIRLAATVAGQVIGQKGALVPLALDT
ncbi:sugar kinase [Yoonia sp. BS5-3]|uniref:Sugar kinase n=1 Tax=Yoonia phaeophyticola TaxID=3137369 RepID=A0ABZ2V5B6_9RHOB